MTAPWTLRLMAEDLLISTATLRNWQRTGSLPLFRQSDIRFPLTEDQRQELKRQVEETGRLQQRAHRLQRRDIRTDKETEAERPMEEQLFLLAKGILEDVNLPVERRKAGFKELDSWEGHCQGSPDSNLVKGLMRRNPEDPLGQFIEEVHPLKMRIAEGRYFTPFPIIRQMFRDQKKRFGKGIFLDPALGSGRFITEYLRAGGDPQKCYGLEKDPLSLRAARLNFLLQSPSIPREVPLYKGDSLKADHPSIPWERIGWMMSNPPWGSLNGARRKAYPQEEVWKKDLFSLFIHLAVENLLPGGGFSFILPQSLISQNKHAALRKALQDRGSLKQIRLWENHFPGIQSSTIGLTWRKQSVNGPVRIKLPERNYSRVSSSLDNRRGWDIFMDRNDLILEKKMYTIAGQRIADLNPTWFLGLVTGNNNRFLEEGTGGESLIRGRDILPGEIADPSVFLQADFPQLQQSAPEELYRRPCKVVYRFVSTEPCAALDRGKRLLLNSANALILPEERSMELLVRLLNSRLYRYLFRRKYPVLKILRSHLEDLPFPALSEENWEKAEPWLSDQDPKLQPSFDRWLEEYYRLNDKEKEGIEKDQNDLPAGKSRQ